MRNQTGVNVRGNAISQFIGYVQPTLVAISPLNGHVIVAGAADAGIFLSIDGGATWSTITDNTASAGNPLVPRPFVAHFGQEASASAVYVGTRGRGVWKIGYTDPKQVCKLDCADLEEPCRADCRAVRDDCMSGPHGPGDPTRAQCAQGFQSCDFVCTQEQNRCEAHR